MVATPVVDTGHGASITFATTGGTWKVRSITGLELTLPVVDSTYLASTTTRDSFPGDLADISDITLEVLFQGTQGVPALGVVETITVTFPLPGGGAAVAPSIAGTGFIAKVKYPNLRTNELQVAEIHFRYDGTTGPTYTVAS